MPTSPEQYAQQHGSSFPRSPGQGLPVAVRELKPFALYANLLLSGALSGLGCFGIFVAIAGGGDDTLSEQQFEFVEEGCILEIRTKYGTETGR